LTGSARQPHSHTYTLTPDGLRFAIFYTKVHNRVLGPLFAADTTPATAPLRQALKAIDMAVTGYIANARLPAHPKLGSNVKTLKTEER
jgi:hypothetical protein